jgi:hypothetical protein
MACIIRWAAELVPARTRPRSTEPLQRPSKSYRLNDVQPLPILAPVQRESGASRITACAGLKASDSRRSNCPPDPRHVVPDADRTNEHRPAPEALPPTPQTSTHTGQLSGLASTPRPPTSSASGRAFRSSGDSGERAAIGVSADSGLAEPRGHNRQRHQHNMPTSMETRYPLPGTARSVPRRTVRSQARSAEHGSKSLPSEGGGRPVPYPK